MKLKVCGMRDQENIKGVLTLKPDFMGLIFYPKSPRYVDSKPKMDQGGEAVKKVGVFVNQSMSEIIEKWTEFDLDYIQLHGDESVEMVKELKEQGLRLIKVFRVKDSLPLESMQAYEPYVDFFLFDTKTEQFGGSGTKFDWTILETYNLDKPFFLSGGIGFDDLETIQKIQTDKLYAIDINSRFEVAPAVKDIDKIKELNKRLVRN